MHKARKLLAISFATTVSVLHLFAQEAGSTAKITVGVNGKSPLVLTQDALGKMIRHTVTVKEHGVEATYEGVLLRDVLQKAGVPFGSQLRGKALSSYVLATARDGYAVVYTLAEMDPEFTDSPEIIIADHGNGKSLPDQQGPLRIVVPHDKKLARSLRMLDRIEVVQLKQ